MSEVSVKWFPTDKHVFGVIFREHKPELTTFSSFSNPEPSELSSEPQMMTEWGFKGADAPLIKHRVYWEHGNREMTELHEYWIAIHKGEES